MAPQNHQNPLISFSSLTKTAKRMPESQSTATAEHCLSRLCDFDIKSIGSVDEEPRGAKPIIEESVIVYDFFQLG